MHDDLIKLPWAQQYRGSFQELADARRVLKTTNRLRQTPVLDVADRQELERIRALAIRCVEAATAELIETLDALHSDVDREDDDPAEYSGDEHDAAWTERLDQARAALPRIVEMAWHGGASEDAEDDDGGGSCTDDEPGFDARSRRLANALGDEGAGCAINGDCEPNGDEADYSSCKVDGI